ncbi:hypothetical protein [Streptomyces sp. RKAG290]|uniref:hypothetical protein n=1 Tax=Streptomyces sp. RKAG290 TaxID=2888348 RepID=UPI0020345501|nr:hypothetical protein [Streptomyces sp. RKAG290]MCM2412808.1 hypothetical protein [Streptomyces sp. RKAG290]
MLEYMSSCREIYTTMGADLDVISNDEEFVDGAGSIITDGTWVWPLELQYYIRRYHVELPEDFLVAVRAANYTPPEISSARYVEIVDEIFGPSAFGKGANTEEGGGGFFSWYLADLTSQRWGRLLRALESAGLNTRHLLTDDVFLARTGEGGSDPLPVHDVSGMAVALAGPGDGEFELHLWLALDIYTIVRVRRLDDTTTAVVYEIAHLQEPEREEVVAALVRALDEFRDDCRGFVLDRAGRSSREAWDSLILECAWPSEPFPDSVAVDAGLGALPPGSDAVTRAEYGHLAVFNRNRMDGGQA